MYHPSASCGFAALLRLGAEAVILRASVIPLKVAAPSQLPKFLVAASLAGCLAIDVLWNVRRDAVIEAPAILILVVALALVVTLTCAGQLLLHQRFPERNFVQHNEVGGFIIAVTGTLYSVLLGFLTVVAWQHFADARQLVALESAAAADIWHVTMGLPREQSRRVRTDILNYADLMAGEEWTAMRTGGYERKADYIVMDAMSTVGLFKPNNLMQSNAQTATIQELSALHDLRQRRLAENDSGIAGFEWLVLALGGTCIICFCWIFGLVNRRVHVLMTASVAIVITSTLVLLFELQFPFRTDMRIEPSRWIAAIDHIHLMQAGWQPAMRM